MAPFLRAAFPRLEELRAPGAGAAPRILVGPRARSGEPIRVPVLRLVAALAAPGRAVPLAEPDTRRARAHTPDVPTVPTGRGRRVAEGVPRIPAVPAGAAMA